MTASPPSDAPPAPGGPAEPPTPSRRGFASMTPERRREVSAKGGASVLPHNRSFFLNPSLASEAGRKGGRASRGGGRPRFSNLPD